MGAVAEDRLETSVRLSVLVAVARQRWDHMGFPHILIMYLFNMHI